MGDGVGLPIQHMGKSFFHSPYASTVLKFNQLLHLPFITKNLISVSRFATDNKVFLEFHVDVCFVKDQVSKAILMQGQLRNGLYVFPKVDVQFLSSQQPAVNVSPSSCAFVCVIKQN